MKIRMILSVLAVLFVTSLAQRALAQDPIAVGEGKYKLVFENERIRVMTVTFQPGEKVPKHSHPDHCGYVLEAGKLRISKDGAQPMEADLTVGQVLWIPAETHWAENIGSTPIKILVTELKDKPAAPAAAK